MTDPILMRRKHLMGLNRLLLQIVSGVVVD